MATGYPSKTTDLGTCASIAMAVREVYPRPTMLPSNWHQVRIGTLFSIIGLNANDNTAPVVETVTFLNNRDRFALGLFNGAANGCFGDAGTRFVGLVSGTLGVGYAAPNYNVLWPSSSYSNYGAIGDGATVALNPNGLNVGPVTQLTPAGTVSFCSFVGVDIALTATGATVRGQVASNITDTSVINLRRLMLDTSLVGAAVTGGWWGAGLDSGLTHLYVRSAHNQNRLRIHGLQVQQIA